MVPRLLERTGERDQPLHMTEVNYAEVKYIVLRKEGQTRWAAITTNLPPLPIEFHPVTRPPADVAAELKARHGIGLADAFAAALARLQKADLVTGDPEFKALESELKIKWPG